MPLVLKAMDLHLSSANVQLCGCDLVYMIICDRELRHDVMNAGAADRVLAAMDAYVLFALPDVCVCVFVRWFVIVVAAAAVGAVAVCVRACVLLTVGVGDGGGGGGGGGHRRRRRAIASCSCPESRSVQRIGAKCIEAMVRLRWVLC